MTIEWENDAPAYVEGVWLDWVTNVMMSSLPLVVFAHFVHVIIFFLAPKVIHKDSSKIPKFFWQVLRRLACFCMMISYLLVAFCLCGYLWIISTFNFNYKLPVTCFVLLISIGIIFVYGLWMKIIMLLWRNGFITSRKHAKDRLISLKKSIIMSMQKNNMWMIFFVLCSLGITLLYILSYGLCLPSEPDNDVSTTISRMIGRNFFDEPYCSSTGICYLYLLVPEDLSTQMQVIFHSTEEPLECAVYYGKHPDNLNRESFGRSDLLNNFEITRYVSSIMLNGLEEDSVYYFQASLTSWDGTVTHTEMRKFRTAPSLLNPNSESIEFIIASDIGRTEMTSKITEAFAKKEPYFVGIGGDLAYENAFPTCYCRWDWLFDTWNRLLITPDGFTIPLLTAVGNHETSAIASEPMNVAFYLDYFPYSDGLKKNSLCYWSKPIEERKLESSYHSHNIGNVMEFISLDSGHIVPHSGEQLEWLEGKLRDSLAKPFRTALYHTPLYPGRREITEKLTKEGREYWMPVFDKYHLSVGFENHDHIYKRTYPLKDDKIDSTGTIYIGDGAWGVSPRKAKSRWYIENSVSNVNYYVSASLSFDNLRIGMYTSDDTLVDGVDIKSSPLNYY